MRRTLASIQYLNYILATCNNKIVGQTAADAPVGLAVKSADYTYIYFFLFFFNFILFFYLLTLLT